MRSCGLVSNRRLPAHQKEQEKKETTMRRPILVKAVLLAFAGILLAHAANAETARGTRYQPSFASETRAGYSETQIDTNRLRVSFTGEAGTDRESVETNLLYRAAELTMQRGYDWFTVINHSVEENTETIRRGPPLPPIGPKAKHEVSRYQAVSEIVMMKGARPAENTSSYEARAIQANLQWKIVR
jgi:hypothetical protein